MARTTDPTADVEKALKALEKATEKHETAQAKADDAYEAKKRAQRELEWYARHPDLPEDFDLEEFRRSLEAPFDGDDGPPGGVGDTDDEVEPFDEEPNEVAVSQGDDIDLDDDVDPFDDED